MHNCSDFVNRSVHMRSRAVFYSTMNFIIYLLLIILNNYLQIKYPQNTIVLCNLYSRYIDQNKTNATGGRRPWTSILICPSPVLSWGVAGQTQNKHCFKKVGPTPLLTSAILPKRVKYHLTLDLTYGWETRNSSFGVIICVWIICFSLIIVYTLATNYWLSLYSELN